MPDAHSPAHGKWRISRDIFEANIISDGITFEPRLQPGTKLRVGIDHERVVRDGQNNLPLQLSLGSQDGCGDRRLRRRLGDVIGDLAVEKTNPVAAAHP